MSSIQYQLNKRYHIEIKQKIQKYYNATEHIRKERVHLRNVLIPKIIMKNGIVEYIYPNKFHTLDKKYQCLQDIIWKSIFGEHKITNHR